MPLHDHFHPPLSEERSWDAFHSRWATALADALNLLLPSIGCFAEALATRGRVEIDVALERDPRTRNGAATRAAPKPSGGVATKALPAWTPAAPTMEFDVVFPPEVQVLVFADSARTLVGAIELVSPGNKDRPAARRAFAVKCLSYLQNGVGLIVADIVTERSANLHDEIAGLTAGGAPPLPGSPATWAAAYRPFKRGEQDRAGVWPAELRLGEPLPALPLWLRNHETPVRIDLDAAYAEACQKCLID
ncbi:MAG: DUF4058 family protein [Gemmataceae bacterium]